MKAVNRFQCLLLVILLLMAPSLPLMSQEKTSPGDKTKATTDSEAAKQTQLKESLRVRQFSTTQKFANLSDLHRWYICKLLEMEQFYEGVGNVRLIRDTSEVDTDKIPQVILKRKIRFGMEYSIPLNTTNAVFGMNIVGGKSWDVWGFGIVGGGSAENNVILDATMGNTRVTANAGGGVEADYSFTPGWHPYAGLSLSRVYSTGSVSSGNNLNLYAGSRLINYNTGNYLLALDVKVGSPFWSGFTTIGGNNGTYAAAGITLVSAEPFGWAGDPLLATLETSLNYSPSLNVMAGKVTLPIRIFEQFSVGLTGQLGTDARTFQRDAKEISSVLGYGADLRFYGDRTGKLINPYLSWSRLYMEYDEAGGSMGHGDIVHIGNRFKLGKNFFLDVVTGPAFWKTPWAEQFGAPGLYLAKPPMWDAGFGLTYRLDFIKTRVSQAEVGEYEAELEVFQGSKEQLAKILPERKCEPLSEITVAQKLFKADSTLAAAGLSDRITLKPREKQVYAVVENEVNGFGDLTDIKFFTSKVGINASIFKEHEIPYINPHERTQDSTLLIALFDKKKTRVERIKDTNMYLHFADLDNGRYFGYRYDRNRRMQPEYRDLPINRKDATKSLSLGNYEKFVLQMQWLRGSEIVEFLDEFEIPKDLVAKWILKIMKEKNSTPDATLWSSDPTYGEEWQLIADNYEIAYVLYPSDIMEKLKTECPNFGVSIMFRFDTNSNFIAGDPLNGHFIPFSLAQAANRGEIMSVDFATAKKDGYISTDFDDFAFFSNVVHGRYIYSVDRNHPGEITNNLTFRIEGFALGESKLTDDHKRLLTEWINTIKNDLPKVTITGSVDATPYPPEDMPKQEALAKARAMATLQFLKQIVGDAVEIQIIAPGKEEQNLKERAATIVIVN